MTLAEFSKRTGILPTTPTTERAAVTFTSYPDRLPSDMLWSLYHLEDYAVTTISGPVVWLIPRS